MLPPRRCKVSIYNETYHLVSDEPEEHIAKAADLVDTLVRQAVASGSSLDFASALILVALRLASNSLIMETEKNAARVSHEKIAEMLQRDLSL